jgi:hypothetical protein
VDARLEEINPNSSYEMKKAITLPVTISQTLRIKMIVEV